VPLCVGGRQTCDSVGYGCSMTVRHLMWASLATGLIATVWLVSSLSDPAYYDPQTVSDYLASALAEIMFIAFAYTYVVWWRVTPVRRGALMLPAAALGFVLWSAGDVLEEIMEIEFGAWLFFVGAFVAYVLTAIAGVVTLTAPVRWRWSGLVLLGITLSLSNQDFHITPVPWLVFAFVLWRGLLDEPTTPSVREPT
jgi:hypothetical protein